MQKLRVLQIDWMWTSNFGLELALLRAKTLMLVLVQLEKIQQSCSFKDDHS